jgi:hypothetical protein
MYVYLQTNLYLTSWFKIIWCKMYLILRFTFSEWLNIYISSLIYVLIILFYFKYFFIQFSFKQWSLRFYFVEYRSLTWYLINKYFIYFIFRFSLNKYYKQLSSFWNSFGDHFSIWIGWLKFNFINFAIF